MLVDRKCKQCEGWFTRPLRKDTKRGQFCSQRCQAFWHNKRRPHLTTEMRRKGAAKSAETRRAQALARLKDLTPIEIYRKAYSAGWHRGARYARGVMRAQEARS